MIRTTKIWRRNHDVMKNNKVPPIPRSTDLPNLPTKGMGVGRWMGGATSVDSSPKWACVRQGPLHTDDVVL